MRSRKIVIVNTHTLKFQSSGEIESAHEFEVYSEVKVYE